MDERLEKALNFSNYIVTLNNQKKLIREKMKQALVYYTGGGTFTVTPELLILSSNLIELGRETFVLLDDNEMPVKIENLKEFRDEIFGIYESALLEYQRGYDEMKKKRSVESLIEYE